MQTIDQQDFLPIQVVASFEDRTGLHFLNINQVDSVPSAEATAVQNILKYCDGRTTVQEIAKRSKQKPEFVLGVLEDLVAIGVVTDSRNQALHFHQVSSYPTPFSRTLSDEQLSEYTHFDSRRLPLIESRERLSKEDGETQRLRCGELILQRFSCRTFDHTCDLSAQMLTSICRYAYGAMQHAVPSGGGLYPLYLYVLVEQDQCSKPHYPASSQVPSGYYYFDNKPLSLGWLTRFKSVDEQALKYCFNDVQMPFGTSVQIVIVGDLERQTYKYGNRGYRLTLLEAGHVAQNINLCCTELGLGSCELGGVLDEAMATELELPSGFQPLLAIAIGRPAEYAKTFSKKVNDRPEQYRLLDSISNITLECFPGILLHEVRSFSSSCFFGATASYQLDGSTQIAGATATDYATARSKAIIEAYERWACSKIRVDCIKTEKELHADGLEYLSPDQLIPLSPEQAKACGVEPYHHDLPIKWVKGRTIPQRHSCSREVLLPCDYVFYGHQDVQIYHGNSSGVAAHSNYATAVSRALTELIERHAIMKSWYTHNSPSICSEDTLPVHAKNRSHYWKKQGRQYSVLVLEEAFGCAIIQVAITSNQYPFFVSGAAASITKDGLEEALNKATEEAEYSLLIALSSPNPGPIKASEVWTPSDHGRFYAANRDRARELSWLLNGHETNWDFVMYAGARKIDEDSVYTNLYKHLDVICVDITSGFPLSPGLRVIRAVSPKLIPINFGTCTAHYDHPALRGYDIHPDAKKLPHYFA